MTHFLITGATGRLGSSALACLAERVPADRLHPLTRTGAGRYGDYDDPASLEAAFDGIDRLLFVSSPELDPERRIRQHLNVLGAAKNVEHIVYTSARGAQHDPGHRTTEEALASGGIPHTILRNSLYTEPFVEKAIGDARAGAILSASAGQPLTTASIADLGEAAARALLDPPAAPLWELRGPAWTYADLAAALSERLGRPVEAREVGDAETGPFAPLFPLVRAGLYAAGTDDLERLLGRPPQDVAAVITAA